MALGRAGRSARRLCRPARSCQSRRRTCGESNATPQILPPKRDSTEETPECRRRAPIPTRVRRATRPACTGSSTTAVGAAAGGAAPRHPARALARRGPGAGRDAQPRRRVVPPAREQARYGDGDGDAVRREVLEIVATRGKMQNPVTGSGGMLDRHRRGGRPRVDARPRGRRPGRHPGLPDPDPAGDRGRPRALGRGGRAGARPTATPSCSAAPSPQRSPTTCRRR